jgi:hypothetical protein
MIVRRKHWALSLGYDIATDNPFGFTLCLGHREKTVGGFGPQYRFVVAFSFDWPRLTWIGETWRLNEPGCVRGLPIARAGMRSSAWTGREYQVGSVSWDRSFYWARYD